MKKFILSALAVGALGIGGLAQADVIDGVGNTISRIFGVPYDASPTTTRIPGTIQSDANGNRYQVDNHGNLVPLGTFGTTTDQWGRTVYLGENGAPIYSESNGRYNRGAYAQGRQYDADRDGVPDQRDRYPRDARYR